MSFIVKKSIALLSLSLIFAASAYATDQNQLSALLKQLNNVSGAFVQHTFDGKGDLLQTQKGTLAIRFPNQFRWKSEEPYAQLLVSNGNKLWQYDEDLEQVTVQKLDQRITATPALLLSGSHGEIEKEYDIYSELLQSEQHFVLIPKSQAALFDRLRLEFDGDKKLVRMVIKDEVGQKTVIRLLDMTNDSSLSSSSFEFEIPEGTDVITSE